MMKITTEHKVLNRGLSKSLEDKPPSYSPYIHMLHPQVSYNESEIVGNVPCKSEFNNKQGESCGKDECTV